MSELKSVFKPKQSKNNSSKTPTYYNEEKNRCITEGSTSQDPSVRKFFATNSHTPTKVLVGMLETEQDKQILKEVLLNNKLPRKSVAKFVNDSTDKRVEWYEDDVEIVEHFQK